MCESLVNKIDWQKCNNLVPTIIQDENTLEVLMLGFMNQEALILTGKTKKVHFYSRTKGRIWMKGEESSNILNVKEIKIDCDNDSLLIIVDPIGNTCHNGDKSCFKERTNFIAEFEDFIEKRFQKPEEDSYISSLQKKGINKIAQKVGEEATEVIISALNESNENFINECADLLFHSILLLKYKNLSIKDVLNVMKTRDKRKIK